MKRSASSPRAQRSPALSIWQPWLWAIMWAGKNIENRTWPTRYQGWVALHAGAHYDPYWYARMAARVEKASGMLPPTRWQGSGLQAPGSGLRENQNTDALRADDGSGRGEAASSIPPGPKPLAPGPVTAADRRLVVFGAVVAVARIVGVFEPLRGVPAAYRGSPWIDIDVPDGKVPYCWVLEDVRALAVPVPCKGRQLLFELPAEVAAAVRQQLSGARPEAGGRRPEEERKEGGR